MFQCFAVELIEIMAGGQREGAASAAKPMAGTSQAADAAEAYRVVHPRRFLTRFLVSPLLFSFRIPESASEYACMVPCRTCLYRIGHVRGPQGDATRVGDVCLSVQLTSGTCMYTVMTYTQGQECPHTLP